MSEWRMSSDSRGSRGSRRGRRGSRVPRDSRRGPRGSRVPRDSRRRPRDSRGSRVPRDSRHGPRLSCSLFYMDHSTVVLYEELLRSIVADGTDIDMYCGHDRCTGFPPLLVHIINIIIYSNSSNPTKTKY
jgi:hypothetical protein